MRAVLQRVTQARVRVDGRTSAVMQSGLLVLLGAGEGDSQREVDWMVEKITHLRIFADEQGRMNRSLLDVKGAMIAVSQFTLYGDCRRGRRPSFVHALEPDEAEKLCASFVEKVRARGIDCGTGEFGAHMQVELVNDGPVTLLLDTAISRRSGQHGFSEAPP